MTQTELKTRLSLITGESNEDLLSVYLDMAKTAVLKRCYPYRYEPELTVPMKYQADLLEIAVYLLNKRGAEGETSHGENGINREYEAASVPDSMLKHITPFAESF